MQVPVARNRQTALLRRSAVLGLSADPVSTRPTPVIDLVGHGDGGEHPSELLRRFVNVLVATVAILLAVPLMLVVALLVRLTSSGPVFYSQTRVGLDRRSGSAPPPGCRRLVDYGGRLFTIYKFRTMYVDARTMPQVWAIQNDPRVTPIGRILRKTRLDELPQLFNVLKGDMNIVGPRPEQPRIVLDLKEKVESYTVRQRVLPGITGWAQINQPYDQCLEDVSRKVALDLEYLSRRSVWEDLKIMLITIPVVLLGKGGW